MPIGRLFGWSKIKQEKHASKKCNQKCDSFQLKTGSKITYLCSEEAYDKKQLQCFLRKCGRKKRSSHVKQNIQIDKCHEQIEKLRIASPSPTTQPISSESETPTRATSRRSSLRCRNQDCRSRFTEERSRVRHEGFSCPFRLEESDCFQEIDLTCRFPEYGQTFTASKNRKRHEIQQHTGSNITSARISGPVIVQSTSCPALDSDALFITPKRPAKRSRHNSASCVTGLTTH